jgi:pyruvate/2-oxoglutarate dehydrogenase complex dihydrolipoamide dehydrogenase (E3) component
VRLAAIGPVLREEGNARLEGDNGAIARFVFADGTALRRGALFVRPEQRPLTELEVILGCDVSDNSPFLPGLIPVDAAWQTTVPSVYAAGDVATPTQ